MAKEPIEIELGQPVITLMFFRLAQEPKADFVKRYGTKPTSAVTGELLNSLSDDFMSVEERAEKVTSSVIQKLSFWSTILVAIVAVLGVMIPPLAGQVFGVESRIEKLEKEVEALRNAQQGN
jgi:hypothetical protein